MILISKRVNVSGPTFLLPAFPCLTIHWLLLCAYCPHSSRARFGAESAVRAHRRFEVGNASLHVSQACRPQTNDVGGFEFTNSHATAINANGTVVGFSFVDLETGGLLHGGSRPFVWRPSSPNSPKKKLIETPAKPPVDGELVFKRRLAARISHGSGFANCSVQGRPAPRLDFRPFLPVSLLPVIGARGTGYSSL